MKLLIMVRHGESLTNANNFVSHDLGVNPLTDKGILQIKAIALELKKISADRLIASPLLRTKQTAEIISEIVGLKVLVDERLSERDLGKLNNMPAPSGEDWHKNDILTGYPSGFEPWESLRGRMSLFINDLPEASTTIIVSHGAPIKAAVADMLELDEMSFLGVRIAKGSVTVIEPDSRRILAMSAPAFSEYLIDSIRKLQESFVNN